MSNTLRHKMIFRLLWAVLALCVLAACFYVMANNLFHTLPHLWRMIVLAAGWILAILLIIKALPEKASGTVETKAEFPSAELSKILDAQEALQIGFVALDSHARMVVSNPCLGKLLDLREATGSGGLSRVLHPDNAHIFKNTFQEVCQSSSGTTTIKLRSFDKIQQIHHLQVALTRWKESPVAVIAMLWDISEEEQSKQELQTTKAALHDLHGVFAADGSSLLDTMRALLELGNLHFRAEIGVVAKLKKRTTPQLEVMQVLAPHEEMSRGQVFDPIATSGADFPRVLRHAGFVCCDEDALPPPVFKATREETFLGAPIYVQRRLFGVVCFASPHSRPEGFSSSELELVQFIANWLGGEIERRQLIADFENRQNYLAEANASLEALLQNDLLTGLFNKMALDDRLDQEFERARLFNLALSVMALSPNNFEDYRKKNGEAAANKALESFGATIEQHVRNFDIVARYEESTFVVVCPQNGAEDARMQAEILQTALAKTLADFTISLGVVSLNTGCSNSKELLSDALDACQIAQLHAKSH